MIVRGLSILLLAGGLAACSAHGGVNPPDGNGGKGDGTGGSGGVGGGSGGSGGDGGSGGSGGGGGGTTGTGDCAGVVLPAPAHPADCSKLDAQFATLKAQFQASLTKAASGKAAPTGGALTVVCGGQVRTAGIGTVKPGGAAVTTTTRFQLASMTKMLTATTAMALAKKGTIDVSAPVSKILPALTYGQVTLDQVLSHSAGLPIGFPSDNIEVLDTWLTDPANEKAAVWAPPGAVWYYNNDGYAVAGGLLQTAAAQPFPTLVHDNVLVRFGMTHATMLIGDLTSDFAYGNSVDDQTGTKAVVLAPTDSYYGSGVYGPMGGAWASADDMGAWMSALLGHSSDSCLMQPMMKPHIRTGVLPMKSYGYGLTIDQGMQPTVVSHSGSVQGFLSDMEFIPDADVGVVALVNGDAYFPDDVTVGGLKAFVSVTEMRPASPPAASRYPLYTGTYQSLMFGKVVISVKGTALQAQFVNPPPDINGKATAPYTTTLTQDPNDLYDNYTFNWNGDPDGMGAHLTFWVDGTTPAPYIVSDFGVGTRQ